MEFPNNKAFEVEKPRPWYFTFGCGGELQYRYVRIIGTFSSARAAMFGAFGSHWAFQYAEEEFAHQIDDYKLKELIIAV